MLKEDIIKLLSDNRRQRKVSMEQVAVRAHRVRSSVENFENGKNVSTNIFLVELLLLNDRELAMRLIVDWINDERT